MYIYVCMYKSFVTLIRELKEDRTREKENETERPRALRSTAHLASQLARQKVAQHTTFCVFSSVPQQENNQQ